MTRIISGAEFRARTLAHRPPSRTPDEARAWVLSHAPARTLLSAIARAAPESIAALWALTDGPQPQLSQALSGLVMAEWVAVSPGAKGSAPALTARGLAEMQAAGLWPRAL